MVQTTIQNICAVDNLHKKVSRLDNCAIFFLRFFLLSVLFASTRVRQNSLWTAASDMRAATVLNV